MWRCGLVLLMAMLMGRAVADETVHFEAARYRVGELQQRLARERGDVAQSAPAVTLTGYLSRPAGPGPFAAVVYLHGCLGLGDFRRASAARQMTGWGYVALVVDSFTPRGIKEDCSARLSDRQADALGALRYLATLDSVDPKRVALVGISQGGIAALQIATVRSVEVFDMPAGLKYKAAVAFYPSCAAGGNELAIPVLVLIGMLDDWSWARECEWWALRRRGKGAPVTIEAYPEAYHSFDNPNLRIAERAFGHWMKYDADATAQANATMRDFLAAQLK